jgi:hypothetical protein
MTNHTSKHDPGQAVQRHFALPRNLWPWLTLAVLIAALLIGVLYTPQPAVQSRTAAPLPAAVESARYAGLAEFHLAREAANRQQALTADATRYTGMAESYLARSAPVSARALEADAARYSGLATYHLEKAQVDRQRALEAASARYSGLAEFYGGGE